MSKFGKISLVLDVISLLDWQQWLRNVPAGIAVEQAGAEQQMAL